MADIDDILASLETPEEEKTGEKQLTKAQLKRLRKKNKAKAGCDDDDVSATPKTTPVADGGKRKKKGKGPSSAAIAALKAKVEREKEERERAEREAEERQRQQEEEEKRRLEEEKQLREEKEAKAEARRLHREKLKKEGKLLTKAQKEKQRKAKLFLEQMGDAGLQVAAEQSKPASRPITKKKKKKQVSTAAFARLQVDPPSPVSVPDAVQPTSPTSDSDAWDASSEDEAPASPSSSIAPQQHEDEPAKGTLRSPIGCILGHVDTGKTKILDKIRNSSVQDKEAGGITQQIGASYFPMEVIERKTEELNRMNKTKLEYNVPGLLIIDTPGHESFTNLRSRGSSLCDIAVLVVDLMHGLEQQTLESINLLRARETPFIIALNKVDRIYDWDSEPWGPFRKSYKRQKKHAQNEFQDRLTSVKTELQSQGLNCELYWKNSNLRKNVSIVPTSAITGEGLPDLLMLLVQLTQRLMNERLQYLSSLECTVLEVKQVSGKGTTIDVILSNGVLHKGDTIVVCGLNGPIVTHIRALLTPAPLAEIRVKGEYISLDRVQAAAGIKISAPGLEDAIAGSPLLVAGPKDNLEDLKDAVMQDLAAVLSRVDRSGLGVTVQASSIGSLEALLQFLKDVEIPVSSIAIGNVYRRDVIRASAMVDRKKEYAVILAFDVPVAKEAQKLADERGVQIFTAEIIYHLFDQFTVYMKQVKQQAMDEAAAYAIFPCLVSIIPEYVFHVKDPLIVGVRVDKGVLKIKTPLCVPDKDNLYIGDVIAIEKNQIPVDEARPGDEVSVRIEMKSGQPLYGRHFDASNKVVSQLTRKSIDMLKAEFKDALSRDEWKLVIKLKSVLGIV